jgi:hypothetical protein
LRDARANGLPVEREFDHAIRFSVPSGLKRACRQSSCPLPLRPGMAFRDGFGLAAEAGLLPSRLQWRWALGWSAVDGRKGKVRQNPSGCSKTLEDAIAAIRWRKEPCDARKRGRPPSLRQLSAPSGSAQGNGCPPPMLRRERRRENLLA